MAIFEIDPDIEQAARAAGYALDSATRILRRDFGDDQIKPADCVALAAVIMAKLNMMHDCDMRYHEIDKADRRARENRGAKP